ncbi:MAG: hypothetical protein JXR25_12495 [Pontiellaceae bacterium]|nr:hypothetical protein [Pontiellaceae bacterium]MBN2785635.1 hypothetical protein [Pontiellaceae bacterium]
MGVWSVRLLVMVILCAFGAVHACKAAPDEIENRAARLRSVLREADNAYYNRGEPILPDAAYDALRTQYAQLRDHYPDLPEYRDVGADVPAGEEPVLHTQPILSLKKAYSDDEVAAFVEACGRDRRYSIMPKIDGFTLVLRYQDGRLVQALTRGDGTSGMDVTPQVIASGCVPLVLIHAPESFEVRGEGFLTFEAFDALNAQREAEGLEPYKSPRNTAAATVRIKDLSVVAQRRLSFLAFDVVHADPAPSTHGEALEMCRQCGLETVPVQTASGADVIPAVEILNRECAGLPYGTDGVVIRLDNCARFAELGATERWPHGAIARKYKTESVETILVGVEWAQGASGRWTPVACFEPVALAGAEIFRASLHSLSHLQALDLRIGDHILVTRAGGAIPSVLGSIPGKRTGDELPVSGPPEEP